MTSAVLVFATFGSFWGVWGASIPQIRDRTGLTDAELGIALLFIGAGALPAMLLTGRAVDRWGIRVTAWAIAGLGSSGALLAFLAHDAVSLSLALMLVGLTSGASDVAMNAMAGRAEREAGTPVITRVHGVFSAFVVVGSAVTGLFIWLDMPMATPFLVVAALSLVTSGRVLRSLPPTPALVTTSAPVSHRVPLWPFVGLGLLGALAFASENAHQNWSAVFATDQLQSPASLGALAPAVFAGAVAITRFAAGGIGLHHARLVLASASAVAALGALVIAWSPSLVVMLVGLVLAAAGTAVLFPTILSLVSARVEEAQRGRATSVVAAVSYVGFVLGPVYVGVWSGAVGLRGALVAVAALGVVLLVLSPLVSGPKAAENGVRVEGRMLDDEGGDSCRGNSESQVPLRLGLPG